MQLMFYSVARLIRSGELQVISERDD